MGWIQNRLSEKSTYAGLAGLAYVVVSIMNGGELSMDSLIQVFSSLGLVITKTEPALKQAGVVG